MRKKISKIALTAVLTTSLATISQAPSKANASFLGRFRSLFNSWTRHNYNLQKAGQGIKLTKIDRRAWNRQGMHGYGAFMNNNRNNNNLGNNPPNGIYTQIKN